MEDETSLAVAELNYNSEASTGEKRKREGQSGSKLRSRVWEHFTKIVKEDGRADKCECNHCHKLLSCSSRSGTTHLLRHITDGICPVYKKDKDHTITISSYSDQRNSTSILPLKYSQGIVPCSLDADSALPLQSLKESEDNVFSGGQSQPRLFQRVKLPQRSASKFQPNGEAWMDEFKSCASKLVELINERIPLGTSKGLGSATTAPDYSISAAVKCLNEFEDIPHTSEMYLDAIEILEDPGERECFLCLPPDPRRRWLQRMLHRKHPLRYSSNI